MTDESPKEKVDKLFKDFSTLAEILVSSKLIQDLKSSLEELDTLSKSDQGRRIKEDSLETLRLIEKASDRSAAISLLERPRMD